MICNNKDVSGHVLTKKKEHNKQIFLIILLFSVVIITSACIGIEENELGQVKTPIWDKPQFTSEDTFESTPIIIMTANPNSAGGFDTINYKKITHQKVLFAHKYENFINYFIYDGAYIIGAQTYDKKNHLLAEARIINFAVFEQFQYGEDGKLVFTSKKIIRNNDEIESIGKKLGDYYLIWPEN